jgi:hypothetical protein
LSVSKRLRANQRYPGPELYLNIAFSKKAELIESDLRPIISYSRDQHESRHWIVIQEKEKDQANRRLFQTFVVLRETAVSSDEKEDADPI